MKKGKEEKQLSTDDEMPRNWPNPGWPGCPGPGRYRMARKSYLTVTRDALDTNADTNADNLETLSKIDPEIPGLTSPAVRKARLDARIILDLEHGYQECDEYNSRDERTKNQFFLSEEFHDPARFARSLSTETTTGLFIIRNTPTGLEVACTVLSRHHRWMGLCPYLEDLKNTDVIVQCHRHRPDAVVAIPRTEHREPDIPPCRHGEKMLSGQEARFLDRIIRFHGGNPVFIDLCRKNREKWGDGHLNIRLIPTDEDDEMKIPQDCYPFHNGPVADWKN